MNLRSHHDKNCGSELARDFVRPARGYSSLRLGRWSAEGITYFATFCTEARKASLVSGPVLDALTDERARMEVDLAWRVRGWVVMPDHVHALFELGSRLSLGRAMARFKSKTAAALRLPSLGWQSGFFEHRLRSPDELRPALYYLLMNPVRAGIATEGDRWAGFYCCSEDWSWFADYARAAVAEPQWLSTATEVASKLAPTASSQRR